MRLPFGFTIERRPTGATADPATVHDAATTSGRDRQGATAVEEIRAEQRADAAMAGLAANAAASTPVAEGPLVPSPHDAVALAARIENEGPETGRGTRPAAVGLLWTDGVGRAATRSLQVLLVLAAVALAVFAMVKLSIVVIPVMLALIVASSTWPLIHFLERHRWPRVLAAVAVLGTVALLLGGAVTLMVFMVQGQWDSMAARTTEGLGTTINWVQQTFGVQIDSAHINEWIEQAKRVVFTKESGAAAASGLSAGAGVAADFITSLVLFIVVLFFFMKDGPNIWNFLLTPAKGAQKIRFQLMGRRAVAVMGGYVRGTVIVALVDAVFIGLGLVFLGVPLAFPLAVLVFITAFIPVVGAVLAGAIAACVTLVTNGLVPAIIVVGIVMLVNQLEGNFLSPVVLGRSLKLHELVVLIALTVGTVLGGIVGTLLSVPIAAVVWALVKAWHEPIDELLADAEQEEQTGA